MSLFRIQGGVPLVNCGKVVALPMVMVGFWLTAEVGPLEA